MMLDDLNAIVLPSLPLLNLNFRVLGSLTLTTQPLTTVSFSLLAVLLITSQPSLVNVESASLRQFKSLSTWMFRNWSQSPFVGRPPLRFRHSSQFDTSSAARLSAYLPSDFTLPLPPSLTSSFQSFTSPPPYLFPISSSLHTPFFRWSSRLTVCCYPGSCLLPCARVRLWFPSHFPPPRSTVAISGLLGCKNIVYRRSAGIGTTSSPVDPSAMHVGSSVKIL